MKVDLQELEAIQKVELEKQHKELTELQMALVGGGTGELVLV